MKRVVKIILASSIPAMILPVVVSCDIGEITPDTPTTDNKKVTYDPDGGTIEGSTETTYCYVETNDTFDKFAHPTPVKENSIFIGWFNPDGELMVNQPITDDITLKARYENQTPQTGNNIVCTINDTPWIISQDSICSKTNDILLTSVETNETQTIERSAFNASQILIGEGVTYIPDYFMYGCGSFNGSIIFSNDNPQLRVIGMSFMENCTSFNSELILPECLKNIGSSFMSGCAGFDSKVDLSSLIAIGYNFMDSCINFKQKLVLPESILLVAPAFMSNCNNFAQLQVDCDVSAWITSDPATVSVEDSSCVAYQNGVLVTGTYKNEFVGFFGPLSSGVYRNLKTE